MREPSACNRIYSTTLTFFAELSEDTSYWDAHLLTDTDLSALGEDEIVITAYTFAGLQHGGLTGEGGEEIPLNDYDDIVGPEDPRYAETRWTQRAN